MKRFLVPVLILVALGGAAAWWFVWRSTPQTTALRTREIAAWGLSGHLGKKFPGCRVVVVDCKLSIRSLNIGMDLYDQLSNLVTR